MRATCLFTVTILLYCMAIVLCAEKEAPSATSTSSNTATSGTRQGSNALAASGLLSTLTSLTSWLPSTGIFPALLLFGLGAMLVPAFGIGMLLREGRRSDYNVQPSNLAFTSNPLFTKNLPPIVYSEKFEGGLNRGIPYNIIKSQPQFQTRSMQQSPFDLNNLVVDILGKIQKSLDNLNTENSKKAMPTGRLPTGEKK